MTVTLIDGVAVHGDKPMNEDDKAAAAQIIKAVREKFADENRELKSENDRLHSKLAQFLGDA